MADQEFLASFAVEIDDTGVERLQSVLSQNREMAEQLAAAFDTARDAVSGFFDQLSAASLATGETSPYQRLLDLAAEPLTFTLDLVTEEAEEKLEAFLQQAQQLFEGTKLPLNADNSPALSIADETVSTLMALFSSTFLPLNGDPENVLFSGNNALEELLQRFSSTFLPLNADNSPALSIADETVGVLLSLFGSTFLPLNGNSENVLSVGNAALEELLRRFSSTFLPLNADASAVISAGQAALQQLQNLYSSTTLTVYVQEVSSSSATTSESSTDSSESKPSADTSVSDTSGSAAPTNSPSSNASGSSPVSKPAGVSLTSMLKAATGGRFSSPTKVEVAEDRDPEYIIPIKKESIAVPLLRQLMGELSDSALAMLRDGFSDLSVGKESPDANRNGAGNASLREPDRRTGISDALSGLPELLASAPATAAPVITQNMNQSVQAPVSIQVTAAGNDPEAVGRSIYDVTENYLMRTLQSALK